MSTSTWTELAGRTTAQARARSVARYTALLGDHVRPFIGARPLKQLIPLEIQAIAVGPVKSAASRANEPGVTEL